MALGLSRSLPAGLKAAKAASQVCLACCEHHRGAAAVSTVRSCRTAAAWPLTAGPAPQGPPARCTAGRSSRCTRLSAAALALMRRHPSCAANALLISSLTPAAQVATPRMLDDGRTLWEADAGLLQRHGLATEAPLAAAATPPQPEEQQHPDDEESESDEEPIRPARECARLLTTLACCICSLRNCMPLRAKRLCMRSADANSVAH